MKTPLIVANWKMNGNQLLCRQFSETLECPANGEVWIAPPSLYLETLAVDKKLRNFVRVGVQNVYGKSSGAYTGEVAATMVRESGGTFAIVGHSERRTQFNESDSFIAQKFYASIEADLIPILCVGESLEEREAGLTYAVVEQQLTEVIDTSGIKYFHKSVVAYEPVWAIGTGKAASPVNAEEVHVHIRQVIAKYDDQFIPILYGGSVNENNVGELWEQHNIDGFLIGGASLNPHTLNSIIGEITR
ncbi:MAG: triose-phosphate isomerase [Gammaproteobacteria bacterium]|nr:triose-phosphate isomerase [Gammaproteobacteria bacterium]MYK42663.1 triose-phosphate isomerase [Gammaproteobacteria bacterium]